MLYKAVLISCVIGVHSQAPGTLKSESHPALTVQTCTKTGCTSEAKSVVIDSNWRWTHEHGQPKNCYTGNQWDSTLCPDVATCTSNCVIEGADAEYKDTYGVNASGAELTMKFVTKGPSSKNVGSRLYLLEDDEHYKLFQLKNKEFTFDVDVSQMPCGLNGALYFVQMDADGGVAKYPTNTAGAKYGTGYCDAQCPHDLKFINGEPNILDWEPSKTDANSGTGKYGTCCVEMDVWEANTMATAFTPHACDVKEQTRCEGVQCGDDPNHRFDGACDKNGCDMQPFRLGNATFFGKGPGFAIDSTKPVTVTTQFVTADGTDTGKLTEIRRHYKQNGKTIQTPSLMVGGKGPFSAVSDEYCQAEVSLFDDKTNFLEKGGMSAMDDAFEKGVVLVMSLWDDHEADMLWLDSTYPTTGGKPGDKRGLCSIDSGEPDKVESQSANASVKYFNIKFGEIGTTDAPPPPAVSRPPATTSSLPLPTTGGYSCSAKAGVCKKDRFSPKTKASCEADCHKSALVEHVPPEVPAKCANKPWMQCDGRGFGGAACCQQGFECIERSPAFHQCVPSKALAEAFVHTQPTAAMIDDFLRDGTTLFPGAGLVTYAAPPAAPTPVRVATIAA